ncbi:carbohydrate ABC transporter permease [Paenibacillus eucommiae]|uniref:ABC-type sugar transport system permease subunit n=1 Tax=Paenibacillus eucommiae TaxID=1355755 RepID=A0ABS4ILQ2_9BACL|nr:sugar ABC transporter permease [Paenibacillus eucommiae]MBP1988482.1 ABC-type sugar transport system permease subunit [Paenibacillus eucommiae]
MGAIRQGTDQGGKKRFITYERRRMFEGIGFISLWLLGVLCFMLYPLATSLKISFTKSTLADLFNGEFVGFANYKAVLVDPVYSQIFAETLLHAGMDIPIIVMFSLFVAVLLNHALLGRTYFRALFFSPVILSGVVMGFLLNQQVGDITMFDQLGTGELMSRIGLLMWRSSVEILIFLGGLQGIPRLQYEAAEVDGATAWECFWLITLPYLSPVILLNVIYATIDSFIDPLNELMVKIKDIAFYGLNFGNASALGWMYFVVVLLFVAIVISLGRRFVYYGGDRT